MTTSTKLVTVLKCNQVWEADIIRERLESAGLLVFVQGGETATSLSYVGVALGGVRVQVPADQEAKARELLEDDERQRETAGPWKCPRCNEPNGAGFDFCYSCSMPRGDTPSLGVMDEDDLDLCDDDSGSAESETTGFVMSKDEAVGFGVDDGNPYRFVGEVVERHAATLDKKQTAINARDADQLVSRAFRWAIVGLAFPIPLFHLVSLGILTQAGTEGAWRVASLRRKILLVFFIDILLLIITALVLLSLFLA